MVSVSELAYEFYTVEALRLVMDDNKTHVSVKNQVNAYRRKLHHAMRYLFRDYMLTACFGEARHGLSNCSMYIPELTIDDRAISKRTDAGELVTQFTVESLLASLKALFAAEGWPSSYGGKKWGTAIKAFDLWERPAVFLDHVFDLKHNGSTLFNKRDYGLISVGSYERLQEYLSLRFTKDPQGLVTLYLSSPHKPTKELYTLIVKATKTTVEKTSFTVSTIGELWEYKPMVFGTKVLSLPVSRKDKSIANCNNCSATFIQKLNEHYCSHCLPSNHGCCNRCETAYKLILSLEGKVELPQDTPTNVHEAEIYNTFKSLTDMLAKTKDTPDEKEKEVKDTTADSSKFSITTNLYSNETITPEKIKKAAEYLAKQAIKDSKYAPGLAEFIATKKKEQYVKPTESNTIEWKLVGHTKAGESISVLQSTAPTETTPRPTVS